MNAIEPDPAQDERSAPQPGDGLIVDMQNADLQSARTASAGTIRAATRAG